jgi:hypothetical protein
MLPISRLSFFIYALFLACSYSVTQAPQWGTVQRNIKIGPSQTLYFTLELVPNLNGTQTYPAFITAITAGGSLAMYASLTDRKPNEKSYTWTSKNWGTDDVELWIPPLNFSRSPMLLYFSVTNLAFVNSTFILNPELISGS